MCEKNLKNKFKKKKKKFVNIYKKKKKKDKNQKAKNQKLLTNKQIMHFYKYIIIVRMQFES